MVLEIIEWNLFDGQLNVIAYHEAGHAIAHHHIGTKIERVYLSDAEVVSGCAILVPTWNQHAERYVTTCVAGCVSDLMYQKKNWTLHRMLRTDPVNADNDFETAIDLLQANHPDVSRVTLATVHIPKHAREAKTILERWWPMVDVVAQRLIVAGEICQPDLTELLRPMTTVLEAEDKAAWDHLLRH